MAQIAWTSRRHNLERQQREANLRQNQAQRQERQALEEQWLRSPVAGVVSEIKLISTTPRGITLDVVVIGERNTPVGDERLVLGY